MGYIGIIHQNDPMLCSVIEVDPDFVLYVNNTLEQVREIHKQRWDMESITFARTGLVQVVLAPLVGISSENPYAVVKMEDVPHAYSVEEFSMSIITAGNVMLVRFSHEVPLFAIDSRHLCFLMGQAI